MKHTLVLLLMIVLPLAANAEGGFFEPKDATGVFQFPALKRVSESTLKIFDSGYQGKCTGTFISRFGHFITATHCIDQCLKDMGAWIGEVPSGENIKIEKIDLQKALGESCTLNTSSGPVSAVLLSIGPGDLRYNSLRLTEDEWTEVEKLRGQGFGAEADFAVFRLRARVDACVPLASTSGAAGKRLWSVGYPTHTNRQDFPNSDGRSLYVSTGLITKSVTDISGFVGHMQKREYFFMSKWITNNLGRLTKEEIIEKLDREYVRPGNLLTSIDIVHGNSGGGVFDSAGGLVAINSLEIPVSPSDEHSLLHYVGGQSLHIRSSYILEKIRAQVSSDEMKRLLDCPESF